MKIGIVVGSIRDGRLGEAVGRWALAGGERSGAQCELIDLASFDVPLLTDGTVPMARNKQYDDERVTAWSQALDACDGYVFVTPEYNHSIPGAFKNAIDSIGPELVGKAVGFVAYGADGGVRAVEHWRTILANFSMHVVRAQVSLGLFTDLGESGLAPLERRAGELDSVFEQVIAATRPAGP